MNLKYELNEKEAELIEAIRNYRLSYPDGYHNYYGMPSSFMMTWLTCQSN